MDTTEFYFYFLQEIIKKYILRLRKENELRKRIIRDHVAQQQEKELHKEKPEIT